MTQRDRRVTLAMGIIAGLGVLAALLDIAGIAPGWAGKAAPLLLAAVIVYLLSERQRVEKLRYTVRHIDRKLGKPPRPPKPEKSGKGSKKKSPAHRNRTITERSCGRGWSSVQSARSRWRRRSTGRGCCSSRPVAPALPPQAAGATTAKSIFLSATKANGASSKWMGHIIPPIMINGGITASARTALQLSPATHPNAAITIPAAWWPISSPSSHRRDKPLQAVQQARVNDAAVENRRLVPGCAHPHLKMNVWAG